MKLADYVIDRVAEEGVEDIFVVYGAANGDLIDGFTRTDKTRYVAVMHEQAGGFAAEGYAKISGNLGAAIATSGPGGHNLVTPIANCFYDYVPTIHFTGNVKTKYQRGDIDVRQVGFQETDIVAITSPITKFSKMVTSPEDIRHDLEKAIHLARAPCPGPVLLDLPIDIQKAEIDPEKLQGFTPPTQSDYDLSEMDRQTDLFLEDLVRSERPVIFIGGGVRLSGGIEHLLKVGSQLNIPIFPTWNSLDVVTDDLPFFGGRVGTYAGKGRNFGIQNSDLLLAVGTRVTGRITGSRISDFARGAKKYLVGIDETFLDYSDRENPEIESQQPFVLFDECIHSDASLFLKTLSDKLSDTKIPNFSDWMAQVAQWRDTYDPVRPEHFSQTGVVNPYAFTRNLSREMQQGDILVGDCGGNIVTLSHAFETKQGQRFLTNNGNSPMGFSFAGAMGAYLASDKNHNVVCVIGDGGFNMNIQELQTLQNYDLPIKTFIINNHVYGITKAFQERNFGGRAEACGPKGYSPPDFRKVCPAYGIKTFTLDSNDREETLSAIRKTLAHDGPAVCDVNCDEFHTYQPSVSGGAPIEDMLPFLPRPEFIGNMIVPPMPGWDNPEGPYK